MRMRAGTSIPLEDHHWDPEAEVAGPVDSATQQVARPDGSILAQPPAKSRSMRNVPPGTAWAPAGQWAKQARDRTAASG